MRALTSTLFYVNVLSAFTSQLILYIATFDDLFPASLSLEMKVYYSSFGTFAQSQVMSMIVRQSATNARLFFAGNDVWPLFATKMQASTSYIAFVHTTDSTISAT